MQVIPYTEPSKEEKYSMQIQTKSLGTITVKDPIVNIMDPYQVMTKKLYDAELNPEKKALYLYVLTQMTDANIKAVQSTKKSMVH